MTTKLDGRKTRNVKSWVALSYSSLLVRSHPVQLTSLTRRRRVTAPTSTTTTNTATAGTDTIPKSKGHLHRLSRRSDEIENAANGSGVTLSYSLRRRDLSQLRTNTKEQPNERRSGKMSGDIIPGVKEAKQRTGTVGTFRVLR